MNFLLDTNVFIHATKNLGRVRAELQSRPVEGLATSVVTLAELLYGASKTPNPQKSQAAWMQVLAPYSMLNFDEPGAVEHARIRALLRHNPIGERDLLIASIALANGLAVVTHNLDEFQRVPGLRCEDWF